MGSVVEVPTALSAGQRRHSVAVQGHRGHWPSPTVTIPFLLGVGRCSFGPRLPPSETRQRGGALMTEYYSTSCNFPILVPMLIVRQINIGPSCLGPESPADRRIARKAVLWRLVPSSAKLILKAALLTIQSARMTVANFPSIAPHWASVVAHPKTLKSLVRAVPGRVTEPLTWPFTCRRSG